MRLTSSNIAFAAFLLIALIFLPSVSRAAVSPTSVPSVNITEDMAGNAMYPALSDDGRYLAFRFSVDLSQSRTDIYLQDRITGTRVNVTAGLKDAFPVRMTATNPSISGDGRYVLYLSGATIYSTATTSGGYAWYLYDRLTATTETIAVSKTALHHAAFGGISKDGRYITYKAYVGALTYGVFVHDRVRKTTVQVGPNSQVIWGSSNERMHISDDGRYISVINSQQAPNTQGENVLVLDAQTQGAELVNVSTAGVRGNVPSFLAMPSMSEDGTLVTFTSSSTNLVPNGTPGTYLRNRVTGTTEKISANLGNGQISANGRFIANTGQYTRSHDLGVVRYEIATKAERGVISFLRPSNPAISGNGEVVAFHALSNVTNRVYVFTADFGPSAGLAVSESALAVTEGGIAATYTVVLVAAPSAGVTVNVNAGSQLSTSPSSLTFTPGNWNTPQTVSVYGVQDGVPEGAHAAVITHTAASADAGYQLSGAGQVNVALTDAIAPTIAVAIELGTVWTQADLPTHGSAAPGATVLVSATNLSTNAVFAGSVIANASGAWSRIMSGLTDGAYELQAEADGIRSNTLTVLLDSHAPVSTLSASALAQGGWYTAPPQFTISASDGVGGRGVARSEYSLNGGAYATFPLAPLSISTQGVTSLCYRSLDHANNTEAQRCVAIAIDSTAPQVTTQFNAADNTLAILAQDGGSGIASVQSSLDGGATWAAYSGVIGFTRDGSHTVLYRVRDNAGNVTEGQKAVLVATVPVITAAASQNAFEAQSAMVMLGSFSDQNGDSTWNIEVDWGDGTPHEVRIASAAGTLGAVAHTYADSAIYTVTVRITDSAGSVASASFAVMVNNLAPSATLLAPGTANEGATVAISLANAVDGSVADMEAGLRYAFACDGSSLAGKTYATSSNSAASSCTVDDSGERSIRARVIDKDEGFTEYTAMVSVANIAPTASLAVPASVNEGGGAAISLSGGADVSTADTQAGLHYAFSCDGASLAGATYAASSSNSLISCAFDDNGQRIVRARVIDKDEGYTEYSALVNVISTPPTAALAVTGPVIEGGSASITLGDISDDSSADTEAGLRYSFACNGASLSGASYATSSSSPGVTCNYPDGPATVTLRARVFDKDGAFSEYTAGVVVANAAPVVGAITAPSAPVDIGTAVDVSAAFTDWGMLDTHTALIDWGDGSSSAATVSGSAGSGNVAGSHRYAAPGFYTVTVRVTDKDGGAGSASYSSVIMVAADSSSVIGNGAVSTPTGSGRLHVRVDYKSGVPTGSVSFEIKTSDFLFESSGFDWLVVTGDKALLQGAGSLNGGGNYGLSMSFIDGAKGRNSVDLVRIKIVNRADGALVYDSQPGAGDSADPTTLLSNGKINIK